MLSQKPSISNFKESRPVGAVPVHSGRRTDRHMLLTEAFCGLCCRAHCKSVMNFRFHTGINVMACEILYKEIPHTFLKNVMRNFFFFFF